MLLLAAVMGCGMGANTDIDPRINRANFAELQKGMTEEEVTRVLGTPDSIIKSEPCDCAHIVSYSYLSGKIAIDIKFFNGKVCETDYTDFAQYEMH